MAESVGALYVRLGLNLSELTSDFINAERSINENMSRLQREQNLIELRAQIELEGMDEATRAVREFEVRERMLTQRLEDQRQRISLALAALRDMSQRTGENSAQTQRAMIALERERLAMVRLENELNELNEAQNEAASGNDELTSSFDKVSMTIGAGMAAATGAIATAAEAVRGLIERFDEAQQKAYELHMTFDNTREYLRHMKFAGADSDDLMGFVRGIDDALVKGDVDDPETMALKKYGVNLFDNSGRLIEYQEQLERLYEGYKRAQESGEEVEYLLMLNGESIHEILPLFERWGEAKSDASKVYDAGLKFTEMHEASREMAMLTEQMDQFKDAMVSIGMPTSRTMMRNLFEVFREGTEYIVSNREELQGWLMTLQGVIGTAIDAVQELNEKTGGALTRALTNIPKAFFKINPLSEVYQEEWFGEAIKERMEMSESNAEQYAEGLEEASQSTVELEEQTKKLGDALSYGWRDSIKRAKEYADELEDLELEQNFKDNEYGKSLAELEKWRERATRGVHRWTEEEQRELETTLASEELSVEKRMELQEKLSNVMKLTSEERLAIEQLYLSKREELEQERADRLEGIRERIESSHRSELENKLMSLEREKEAWISAGMEEKEAMQLAEREKTQALLEMEEEYQAAREAISQTALQRTLRRIDKEKEAWERRGVTSEESGLLAEAQKYEAIEELERSFIEKVKELNQTDLERSLSRIESEKEAWIQKGIDEVTATEWSEAAKQQIIEQSNESESKARREQARQRKQQREREIAAERQAALERANAQRNAAMQVLKSQLAEYRVYQRKGEAGLREYQLKQLYKTGITAKDLQMKPSELNKFLKAQHEVQQSLLPNFAQIPYESPWDRYKPPVSSDEFNARDKTPNRKRPANHVKSVDLERLHEQLVSQVSEQNIPIEVKSEVPDPLKVEVPAIDPLKVDVPPIDPLKVDVPPIDPLKVDMPSIDPLKVDMPPIDPLKVDMPSIDPLKVDMPPIDPLKVDMPSIDPLKVDMPTDAVNISDVLDKLTSTFGTFTEKISRLAATIAEIIDKNPWTSTPSSTSEVSSDQRTTNVTNNVSINNAMAWETEQIQELAERVARLITPAVVSAVGGDSNSY